MKKLMAFIKRRLGLLIGLALVIAAGAVTTVVLSKRTEANDYITQKLEKGTIEVTVSATGTVQAVTTVQVGSQVSGTVSWLGADFNSRVTRGQLVAKLDPAIFQTQVDNGQANVMNAEAAIKTAAAEMNNQKANLDSAKANQEVARVQRDDAMALVKRDQALVSVLSGREIEAAQALASAAAARYTQTSAQVGQAEAAIESAKAKSEQAKASLAQAKAQLDQAKVNLEHTIISSPIDGVVVSRTVDVGQTVAASLQAPTLFTIANDLTKMQVLGSIDEADVGQIREGIRANFTVDAYHGDTFNGVISQIRLNAQSQQNVVTYTAVIEVSNPELKLRPGMTANITIPIAKRENVLMIPNSALRFKPNLSEKDQKELTAKIEALQKQREAEQAAAKEQNVTAQVKEGADSAAQEQPRQGAEAMANKNSGGEHRRRSGGDAGGEGSAKANSADGSSGRGNGNWRHRRDGSQAGAGQEGQGSGEGGRGDRSMKRDGADSNSNERPHRGDRGSWNKDGGNSNSQGQARGGPGSGQRDGQHAKGTGAGNSPMRKDGGNASMGPGVGPAVAAGGQGSSGSQGGSGRGFQGQGGGRGEGGSRRQGQIVYVLTADKKLEPRFVRTGITNGRFTEVVSGDLQEGDVIVTGQNDANGSTRPPQANTNPLQPRSPMGGPRGRP